MKISLFISLLVLTNLSFAKSGDRGGNGGDAIVCFANTVDEKNIHMKDAVSTRVKDYWEYDQMINNVELELGDGKTYQEKVRFVLNRLKDIDSLRADKLIERFRDDSFYSLVTRGQIPTVDDSNSYLKPSKAKGCFEVQVAFQILSPRMFQSKVLIDKDIFNNMDEENKAGLILHELLYEHDIKYAKATDSDTIRWFNYIVSSDIRSLFRDLDNGHSEQYAKMIRDNKVDYFDYSSDFQASVDYKSIQPLKKKPIDENINSTFLPSDLKIKSSSLVDDGVKIVKGKIEFVSNGVHLLDKKLHLEEGGTYKYIFNSSHEEIIGHIYDETRSYSSVKRLADGDLILTSSQSKVSFTNGLLEGEKIVFVHKLKSESVFIKASKVELEGAIYNCPVDCKVEVLGSEIVSLSGKKVSYAGYELNLKKGTIGYLLKAMKVLVSNGKKGWVRSIQRVKLKNNRIYAKLYLPKSKKRELLVQYLGESISVGTCTQSKCLVELEFEDKKLVEFKK